MTKQQKLIKLVYSNSKYLGKHVVFSDNKIFAAKSGTKASKILEELLKKNPSENPIVTYVPKSDALILFI